MSGPERARRDPADRRNRRPLAAWIVFAAIVLVVVVVLGILHAGGSDDPVGSASTSSAPAPSGSPQSGVPTSGGSAPATSGATDPTSATSPPATVGGLPIGITFGGALFGLTRSGINRALDDVVALHMTWIRVDLSWASLRPEQSEPYNWAPMDRIVASASAHHLEVLGLLSYTPAWARAAGCSEFTCPPRDRAEFARFAADTVGRYAPRGVDTYQVWNEPNISLFWSDPDAPSYGALLSATVLAMRRAATGIHVLFGGLAFTTDSSGDIAPATFLREACRGRVCPVDAIGYDPFTYPDLPSSTKRPLNPWQLMSNPAAGSAGILAAANDAGLDGVKIWVTEFGAPTNFPGSQSSRTVTEQQQAAIVVDGLRLARAGKAFIGGYFVDTWRDLASSDEVRGHFGLVRSDGTRKAAFGALARAIAR